MLNVDSVRYNNLEIGVTYCGEMIISIGDTIGLTPVIEELSKRENKLVTVSTKLPELFINNPYVDHTNNTTKPEINLTPCLTYTCKIIDNYANQLNMKLPPQTIPKIYLTEDEILYGKNELKEFDGFKKIAVSLKASNEPKNLSESFIKPLLDRLKQHGYKLIGIGIDGDTHNYEYDKNFINTTGVRQASAIINACDLYLGIDAGLYHVAASLNIPQVVFFRNNESSNNRYHNTFFIESNIKCSGKCLGLHLQRCVSSNRCMDNFNLDKYFELTNNILSIGDNNPIQFRPLMDNDLEFFNEVRNSCSKEFLHDSRTFTLDETKKWYELTENKYYIITYLDENIGYFRTSNYSETDKTIYIGADLHEKFRGKGLGYKSYVKFMPYLFNKFKLNKILLEVLSSNTVAIKLYKKLGFVEESVKQNEVYKEDCYVDSIVMSLTNPLFNRTTCYIVNFYFGDRRFEIDESLKDKLCYVKSQIRTLTKYKHSLTKIIFNFNVEPQHYSYLSEALNLIPKKIQNSEVEVNIRRNYGMSYGAWSDMFKKYMNKYDYYIFNEDDYVIVQDDFDKYLITKFESLPNCGFLCGLVREEAHFEKNLHAGMSSGISSYECLKKVYDIYGELPHSKGTDYDSNERQGQTPLTACLIKLGYELHDVREEYRQLFWTGDELTNGETGIINIHFVWNKKDLFLPAKIYFGETYTWADRIFPEFLRMENDYNSTKYFNYIL